jgi:RNA polymerase sigma-32 factor
MRKSPVHREESNKGAPKLSPQQEQELARRWQLDGDTAARNLLVQSQLGYALMAARRSCRPGTSIEELLAEGSLGLIRAANHFDPERGYRFFTYAKHWVHVYVSKWANRRPGVIARDSRLLSKVRRERARAFTLVGEGPDARRMIAERLSRSEDEVEGLLCSLEDRDVWFDAVPPEQIASANQERQAEPDPERSLLERAEGARRQSLVREALGTLDARELRIVTRRLMADSDSRLTLEQIGAEFGVSRERVRQLEERLKQKLASQLRALAAQERAAGVLAA